MKNWHSFFFSLLGCCFFIHAQTQTFHIAVVIQDPALPNQLMIPAGGNYSGYAPPYGYVVRGWQIWYKTLVQQTNLSVEVTFFNQAATTASWLSGNLSTLQYGNYTAIAMGFLSDSDALLYFQKCENTKLCMIVTTQTTTNLFICQAPLPPDCISNNLGVGYRRFKHTFSSMLVSDNILVSFLGYLVSNRIQNVSLVASGTKWTVDALSASIIQAKRNGLSISSVDLFDSVSYKCNQSSVESMVAKWKSLNIQSAAWIGTPVDAACSGLIFKVMKAMDYLPSAYADVGGTVTGNGVSPNDTRWIFTVSPWDYRVIGPDYQTASTLNRWEPFPATANLSSPAVFTAQSDQMYGPALHNSLAFVFVAIGAVQAVILGNMLQIANGDTSATGLVNAGNAMRVTSMYGDMRFDSSGRFMSSAQLLNQFDNSSQLQLVGSGYAYQPIFPIPGWTERLRVPPRAVQEGDIFQTTFQVQNLFASCALMFVSCWIAQGVMRQVHQKRLENSSQSFWWWNLLIGPILSVPLIWSPYFLVFPSFSFQSIDTETIQNTTFVFRFPVIFFTLSVVCLTLATSLFSWAVFYATRQHTLKLARSLTFVIHLPENGASVNTEQEVKEMAFPVEKEAPATFHAYIHTLIKYLDLPLFGLSSLFVLFNLTFVLVLTSQLSKASLIWFQVKSLMLVFIVPTQCIATYHSLFFTFYSKSVILKSHLPMCVSFCLMLILCCVTSDASFMNRSSGEVVELEKGLVGTVVAMVALVMCLAFVLINNLVLSQTTDIQESKIESLKSTKKKLEMELREKSVWVQAFKAKSVLLKKYLEYNQSMSPISPEDKKDDLNELMLRDIQHLQQKWVDFCIELRHKKNQKAWIEERDDLKEGLLFLPEAQQLFEQNSSAALKKEERTLKELIQHPVVFEMMKDELSVTHSTENASFLKHMELWRQLETSEQRRERFDFLLSRFILANSPYQINIEEKLRKKISENYYSNQKEISREIWDACENEVFKLVQDNTYKGTKKKSCFQQAIKSLFYQRPVEELMIQQKVTKGSKSNQTEMQVVYSTIPGQTN